MNFRYIDETEMCLPAFRDMAWNYKDESENGLYDALDRDDVQTFVEEAALFDEELYTEKFVNFMRSDHGWNLWKEYAEREIGYMEDDMLRAYEANLEYTMNALAWQGVFDF